MSALSSQGAWLRSPAYDSVWILAPAFVSVVAVLLLPTELRQSAGSSPWVWLLLVVGIDVAHVYTTLFRTYFDKQEISSRSTLYWLVPLFCWVVGACLYSLGPLAFWRTLAYLAVFHFVRQQYGFFALYGRNASLLARRFWRFNQVMIYSATVVPLIYWHTHQPKNFKWFTDGDFVFFEAKKLGDAALFAFAVLAAIYVAKEAWLVWRGEKLNVPQNLLLVGTALSWMVGIVYFDDDLVFTATNVVSHGVPYAALVWATRKPSQPKSIVPFAAVFVGTVLLFAFIEEGFWDALVWGEHGAVFPGFTVFPRVTSDTVLALVVPLLAVPQATHYVIDGFIWKKKQLVKEKRP